MEVKRLKASGCLAGVSALVNRYLWGCLEGKRYGINPTPKTSKTLQTTTPTPTQRNQHQPPAQDRNVIHSTLYKDL